MNKSEADPFLGSGHEALFWSWEEQLRSQLAMVYPMAIEEIQILKAQTANDANDLVRTYHAAAGSDAVGALHSIWMELKSRFGSNSKVSAGLKRKLDEIKISKDQGRLGEQVRKLRDVCLVIKHNQALVPDLAFFDTSFGQRSVWEKLPEFLVSRWRKDALKFEA